MHKLFTKKIIIIFFLLSNVCASTAQNCKQYSKISDTERCSTQANFIYIDELVANPEQINEIIGQQSSNTTSHLFSHGKSGALLINGIWQSPSAIASFLTKKGILQDAKQLNIYGCEFAKGEKGKAAVAYLEEQLGICVAASDDITGIDGDWELEVGTSFSSVRIKDYTYNLQGSCECTEYLYLNEVTGGGAVHKYAINPDGSVTEVAGNNGIPWYDSDYYTGQTDMSLPSPHGLGFDSNGNIYIGETYGGDIRRLTCDGDIIPESEFVINNGGFNIGSMGNYLFVNDLTTDVGSLGDPYYNGIAGYDLCTGQEIGRVCHGQAWNNNDWGFYVSPEGTFYSTGGLSPLWWQRNGLTVYNPTIQDFIDNTCFEQSMGIPDVDMNGDVDTLASSLAIGSTGMPTGSIRGVTSDSDGNVYIVNEVSFTDGQEGCAVIYKYSPDLVITAISAPDCAEDGVGFSQAHGIVYSETCDCVYVSTVSTIEDCLYALNASDLSAIGSIVGPAPSGTDNAKGLALLKECCPVPTTGSIDRVVCFSAVGDDFSLNQIYGCDNGVICGADFTPVGTLTGMTFDECSNFITITSDNACGEFAMVGDNLQCDPFNISIKISSVLITDPIIVGDQQVCYGTDAAPLNATASTTDATFQWEMSTTSCDEGWTPIGGATASNYTPTNVTATTYYRVKTTKASTGCASGSCETISNCVMITLTEPSCTVAVDANISCGLNNGALTVTPLCVAEPVTYLWDDANAQTTATATGLTAGTYTVEITDALNRTTTCSATVEDNGGGAPTAPVIAVTNNTCPSTTDGSFSATTACTAGSTLEWSTDSGATWSTTMPTWSDGVSVIARCVDDGDATCFSTNSNEVTATLQDCTSPSTYDVSLTKTVDQAQTTVGSNVVFTITVNNNGDAVTGATVTDVLPNGSVYVSDDSGGAYDSGTSIWTIGNMAAGGTATLNLTIQLTEAGSLTNVATVSINETETDMDNNEDTACVSVPVPLPCSGGGITLTAESGEASYQWYKDGTMISGATNETYLVTEVGEYNYTINGGTLTEECSNQMCCPIIIEEGDCPTCAPVKCLGVTIIKN